MTRANTLYLVRHGENRANLTGEFSSRWVDYPLTARGELQAAQTAAHLRGLAIDAVYASPLLRARQTAAVIAEALGLAVTVSEAFRELQVGALEGHPTAENWALHDAIVRAWLEGDPDRAFPGGDTYHTLTGRLRAGIAQVTAGQAGQRVVIVGHGGQFTFALPALCPGVALAEILAVPMVNCAVTTLAVTPGDGEAFGARLVRWAGRSHLSGAAAEFVPMYPGADRAREAK